jgi:hypothetical protein
MYLETPQNIIAYIKASLTRDHWKASMSNVLIESAGKCFQTKDDIRLLFEHIVSRAGAGKFTIQSLRAASRLLRHRENAPSALTEKTARGMAELTISLMHKESREDKYAQKFFQGVLLLLYLLRFRKVSDYFSPQNTSAMVRFEEGMHLIQKSIYYFKDKKDKKSEKSVAALKEFEDFVHQRATTSYPITVIGLAGEDDD